ncbi:hypothetical protein ABZV14_35185 [Streptosporangium canum]|uniref:hypothetical protein n=1 Tax=Streptosporangium canum TaxID=324952 RepID=UPI0033B1B7AB
MQIQQLDIVEDRALSAPSRDGGRAIGLYWHVNGGHRIKVRCLPGLSRIAIKSMLSVGDPRPPLFHATHVLMGGERTPPTVIGHVTQEGYEGTHAGNTW